jgi:hypothetical protein
MIYTKRGPSKKIKNSYKGDHHKQPNRPIDNIIDEDTIKVLNHNIYNIDTDYVKIGTINIQKGFQHKKEDLINFCIDRSYHLLALTEIGKLNNPTTKPHLTISIHKNINTDNTQTFHTYTYNSPDSINNGIGIILTDHIAKHLIKIEGYENQILILTLCFRKNINIKIIIVYLPANSKHHNDTEKYNTIIKNQINLASRQNHQIILLGDFNINVKSIKNNTTTGDKNWKLKRELITYINSQHLIDNIKSFHDNPPITWTSQSHENTSKRLDYIYTIQELLDNTFYGFTENISDIYFTTDHKIVVIILNKEYFLKYRHYSKYSSFSQNREIIVYKTIPDNFKKLFKDRLDTLINDQYKTKVIRIYKKYNKLQTSNNQRIINQDWHFLKHTLVKIKNSDTLTKFKRKRLNQHQNQFLDFPLFIRQMANSVSRLRNLYSQFNMKRILRYYKQNNSTVIEVNLLQTDTIDVNTWTNYWSNWNLIRKTIIDTINNFKLQITFIYPKTITLQNYVSIKSNLRQLFKSLKFLHNTEAQKIKLQQIQQFILIRNDNLKYNQTKMINSILNRKPKKIVLDRLHYLNKETNELLFITDQKEIELETINHFKYLGKPMEENSFKFNSLEDIPTDWRPFYDKKNVIYIEEINSIGQEINIEELDKIIKELPYNKVPGPTRIVYEDLKLTGPKYRQHLLKLFNDIITNGMIPLEWKKATIYPIPKPKDWECKLNNTRPITLLETTRKLLIKIITKRLNSFLAKNNILQWNNRAGIIGESCFQPIQFTQHVIEQCQRLNQPLWIGLQDLSKAYDRVNVSLLRLALERIHIPYNIVNLLTDLFTDRINNIIINNRTSNYYTVEQGIDQGEIISPLLWIIYYDPMFTKINQTKNLHVNINVEQIRNIYSIISDITHTFEIAVLGYLDDTTWFASSKEQLEKQLKIANSFYSFTDIKINHEKYEILTNEKPYINKEISLHISEHKVINIKMASKKQGKRILGVYINACNNITSTIHRMKQIIYEFRNAIKFKEITHDHIIYLINRVLISRLEYIRQTHFLDERMTDNIFRPIKKLFKNTLHLPNSIHDNIIFNNLFPSINSLFLNQISSHFSFIHNIFNSPQFRIIAI